MEPLHPIRILTVCTGNICRSPVAERLLQAGLDQVQPGAFEVRSAGTHAMVGDPIQPPSADMIRTYGGTPDGFAARQLTPKMLRESDLVLAMTAVDRIVLMHWLNSRCPAGAPVLDASPAFRIS